uniref:3-hydroxyisobutyryl-CoA hydrolase n=1 Tax=Musa acuminata subsp. malaccensis TaxID=214687 RepID=A0A804J460_MUSAM|nr:PREDICTED: probable 3-hydroxyisobutyryl-CoA hydrolase 3 isoform X2 [Musa acuminata subsp. malaccensis]
MAASSPNADNDGTSDQVLVEDCRFTRILTLNRPQQLNALSTPMIMKLLKLFVAYEKDSDVKLLIVKVFAMPETSLGFFPDIGASYFLSRLPGFFGEYLGLTGARLDGAEMLACGLATHFVPSMNLAYLEDLLTKVETSDPFVICASIDQFSQMVPLKASSAYNRLDIIDKCFSKETVQEIISALEKESASMADEWIVVAIQALKKASPISLKVTLRSIREGRLQGVDRCLTKEFRLCCHILRLEASKDFLEGFRAILVDKDRNPKWEPPRLDLVDSKVLDQYFAEVDDANWEDLKLPSRRNLATNYVSKM